MKGHAVWLKLSQNMEFPLAFCSFSFFFYNIEKKKIYGASPPLFFIGSVGLKFFFFLGTAIVHFGFECEKNWILGKKSYLTPLLQVCWL